jgi:hypothetical protein
MANKRLGIGAAGADLFKAAGKMTGAESVAAAAGVEPTASRRARRPREGDDGAPLFTTTFRITHAQSVALRQAALDKSANEGGKADASAVLRDILDGWLAKGGK